MKRALVCAVVFISSTVVAAPMSRVQEVRNSRTLVVQTAGVTTVVELRNVKVRPEDEEAAADYLRRIVGDRWVLVENGDVYRSPDGLFVNDALRRRAWLGATYLGP